MSFTKIDVESEEVAEIVKIQKEQKRMIEKMFQKGEIPDIGIDEVTIKFILDYISNLDCNNHLKNVSMGEREGRVYSELVLNRNFRLCHGIGKSGDLGEQQPKAAGSSLLYDASNRLVLHFMQLSGLTSVIKCGIIPMSMEMTLVLCMRTFSMARPNAKYVLWPQNDKKSILSAINAAGFKSIIIPNKLEDNYACTDSNQLEKSICEISPSSILCILSSTNGDFPKFSDKLVEIGDICKKYEIPHLVTNSHDLLSPTCIKLINKAFIETRLDLIVQSTAELFSVPHGGSFISSAKPSMVERVMQSYSGRASISPILDVFISLIQMGKAKIDKMFIRRNKCISEVTMKIQELEVPCHLKLLSNTENDVSIAISALKPYRNSILLQTLKKYCPLKFKLVKMNKEEVISGQSLKNWGFSLDDYSFSFIKCSIPLSYSRKYTLGQFDRIKNELQKEL